MKLKRKIIATIVLAILSALIYFYLPRYSQVILWYDAHIFYPFQSFRGWWLGYSRFSIGDVIYVLAGFNLFITLLKWAYWLFHYSQYRERFTLSVVRTIYGAFFIYLFFIIGWGANYYKPKLAKSWQLTMNDTALQQLSSEEFKTIVKTDLTNFATFLVNRINEYAPHYHSLSFNEINRSAVKYYAQYTDSKVKKHGLGLKSSFFNWFMVRLGVEGYYNPFTGEGQVNNTLPSFVLPFLISHEIAHQAGIAAEGDANLLAYALCTATDDSSFRYSAYMEIWLYTNRRLYYHDSTTALKLEAQLNKLTIAHLDTLEQISRISDNDYARYSSDLFDSYLKMNDQQEGIRSYSNVAASAWKLEQMRMNGKKEVINIP